VCVRIDGSPEELGRRLPAPSRIRDAGYSEEPTTPMAAIPTGKNTIPTTTAFHRRLPALFRPATADGRR
jgi:hypothetical protein